ncbi:MAG: hypothetical protein K2H63_09245 [Paramuribaculum sp.]|nr:hypothetical protein [Paramuribaculum sp.]
MSSASEMHCHLEASRDFDIDLHECIGDALVVENPTQSPLRGSILRGFLCPHTLRLALSCGVFNN